MSRIFFPFQKSPNLVDTPFSSLKHGERIDCTLESSCKEEKVWKGCGLRNVRATAVGGESVLSASISCFSSKLSKIASC